MLHSSCIFNMRRKTLALILVNFFIEAHSQLCNCDQRQSLSKPNLDIFSTKCGQGNDFGVNRNLPPIDFQTKLANCRQGLANAGLNQDVVGQQTPIFGQNIQNRNCDCAPDTFEQLSQNFEFNQRRFGSQERNGNQNSCFENCGCIPKLPVTENFRQITKKFIPFDGNCKTQLSSVPEKTKTEIFNCAPVQLNSPFKGNIERFSENSFGALEPNLNQCECNNQNIISTSKSLLKPCNLKFGSSCESCDNIQTQSFAENIMKPCSNLLENYPRPSVFDKLAQSFNMNQPCGCSPAQSSNLLPCEKGSIFPRPSYLSADCGNVLQTSTSLPTCQNSPFESLPYVSSAPLDSNVNSLSSTYNFSPLQSFFPPKTCENRPLPLQQSSSSEALRQSGTLKSELYLPQTCTDNGSFQSRLFMPEFTNQGCNKLCAQDFGPTADSICSRPTKPCGLVRSLPIFEESCCTANSRSSSFELLNRPFDSLRPSVIDNDCTGPSVSFEGLSRPFSPALNNNAFTGPRGCFNSPIFPIIESSPRPLVSGPFTSGLALAESFVSPLQPQPLFTPPTLKLAAPPGVTTSVITPPSSIPTQIIHTTVVDNSIASSLANALNMLIMSDYMESTKNSFEGLNGVELVSSVDVNPAAVSDFYEGVTEIVTPLCSPPAVSSYEEPFLPQNINFVTDTDVLRPEILGSPPYINVLPEAVNYVNSNTYPYFYNNLPINPFPSEPFTSPFITSYSPVTSNSYPYFNLPDYTSQLSLPSVSPSPITSMTIPLGIEMEVPEIYAEISFPFPRNDCFKGIGNTSPVAAEISLPSAIPAQIRCSLGFTPSCLPVVSVDAIEPLDSSYGFC